MKCQAMRHGVKSLQESWCRTGCAPGWTQDERGPPKAMAVAPLFAPEIGRTPFRVARKMATPRRLKFNLVRPLDGKTVVFDDTVNFLSFDTEEARIRLSFNYVRSHSRVPGSMIFGMRNAPLQQNLRKLSLKEVAKELGELAQFKVETKRGRSSPQADGNAI